MTEIEDQEPGQADRKARRLLWWATVLAFVSVAVCGLDIMIKNQILAQAKEAQGWLEDSQIGLDRLRKDLVNVTFPARPGADSGPDEAGGAAADGGDHRMAGVSGVRPGPHPDVGPDEDS